jgi:carbonic anhydrase/acetyltransferase-like protein (isoleucine patch superfamily)
MAGALGRGAYLAPGALLSGEVVLGDESSVFPGAILDGVAAPVEICARANVQDNCVLEGRPGYPVRIGERVTVGHNARVIGAVVEADSLIAIGASVLAGARVGTNSIVAANATVPEGMQVPPNTLVIGHGRLLRPVTEAETQRIQRGAREYVRLAREYATSH